MHEQDISAALESVRTETVRPGVGKILPCSILERKYLRNYKFILTNAGAGYFSGIRIGADGDHPTGYRIGRSPSVSAKS